MAEKKVLDKEKLRQLGEKTIDRWQRMTSYKIRATAALDHGDQRQYTYARNGLVLSVGKDIGTSAPDVRRPILGKTKFIVFEGANMVTLGNGRDEPHWRKPKKVTLKGRAERAKTEGNVQLKVESVGEGRAGSASHLIVRHDAGTIESTQANVVVRRDITEQGTLIGGRVYVGRYAQSLDVNGGEVFIGLRAIDMQLYPIGNNGLSAGTVTMENGKNGAVYAAHAIEKIEGAGENENTVYEYRNLSLLR